jgi:hypothetical protein
VLHTSSVRPRWLAAIHACSTQRQDLKRGLRRDTWSRCCRHCFACGLQCAIHKLQLSLANPDSSCSEQHSTPLALMATAAGPSSSCCSCAWHPHLDPTRVLSFTTMSLASSDQPGIAGSCSDTVVFSTSVPMGRVSASAVRMLLAEPALAAAAATAAAITLHLGCVCML